MSSEYKEREKILDQIRRTADIIVDDADKREQSATNKQRGETIRHLVDLLKDKWGAR